jgi:sugar-specific transcriptional regulator TrmB
MKNEILTKIGLSEGESLVYSLLLKEGSLPAGKIAIKAGLKRGLCYKILDQLLANGLIEKIDKKVAIFTPKHPSLIKKIIENKENEILNAKKEFELTLGNMVSEYNMQLGEPYVEFKEGLDGLKYLYGDINTEKKNIKLIRSPYDNDRPGFDELIKDQIRKQVRLQIYTKAITPKMHDSLETTTKFDMERLTERRMVPKESLLIPAQIIIYGDKVAITSFKDYLMTTIIYNPNIKETFEKIFEFMWEKALEVKINTKPEITFDQPL